jgi:hypothetical protein
MSSERGERIDPCTVLGQRGQVCDRTVHVSHSSTRRSRWPDRLLSRNVAGENVLRRPALRRDYQVSGWSDLVLLAHPALFANNSQSDNKDYVKYINNLPNIRAPDRD